MNVTHLSILICITLVLPFGSLGSHSTFGNNYFCEHSLFNHQIEFIAQPGLKTYMIVFNDGTYYESEFNGHSFESPPNGPFQLTTTFPGMHSIDKPATSRTALLFVEPERSKKALQFVDDQVWYWTGPNQVIQVRWPDNCPHNPKCILTRALQPHLIFDEAGYYFNMTVNVNTGEANCSVRSGAPAFQSSEFRVAMAVDSRVTGLGNDSLSNTRVFKWMQNGKICFGPMANNATLVYCDRPANNVQDIRQFFGCHIPNKSNSDAGRTWLIVAIVLLVIIFLGIAIYCFGQRLFRSHKEAINKSNLISSQIE